MPYGIDDRTSFKERTQNLRRDWKGWKTRYPDQRPAQDFVRGRKDNPGVRFVRADSTVFLNSDFNEDWSDDFDTP